MCAIGNFFTILSNSNSNRKIRCVQSEKLQKCYQNALSIFKFNIPIIYYNWKFSYYLKFQRNLARGKG